MFEFFQALSTRPLHNYMKNIEIAVKEWPGDIVEKMAKNRFWCDNIIV